MKCASSLSCAQAMRMSMLLTLLDVDLEVSLDQSVSSLCVATFVSASASLPWQVIAVMPRAL